MPSADFCTEVRVPRGPLSPVSRTRRRPPEVSSTAFTAHPPDLQPQALDGYGLRGQSSARPTWAASYPISVRQVAASLHASFRPASRRRPCASLALHLHQVVQGTCTPRLSNMLGTRLNRCAVEPGSTRFPSECSLPPPPSLPRPAPSSRPRSCRPRCLCRAPAEP